MSVSVSIRLALAMAATLVSLALVAPSALGLNLGDYTGTVKHGPGILSFDLDKVNGHKRVTHFTVSGVEYTCEVGSDGTSDGMGFADDGKIKGDGSFEIKGEVILIGSDPSGKVSGTIGHGKAHGTFKIHGELAGPGTDCTTARLEWRATKNDF